MAVWYKAGQESVGRAHYSTSSPGVKAHVLQPHVLQTYKDWSSKSADGRA